MWGRLGYPRRAVRLRECAVAIVERHGGVVPDRLDQLLALPGVGTYTARAVAAFAYGQRHPVVDTNVRRVVCRAIAGEPDAGPTTRPADLVATEELLPIEPAAAALASAAFMELGAVVCTARAPRCAICPVESSLRLAGLRPGRPYRADAPPAALRRHRPAGTRPAARRAAGRHRAGAAAAARPGLARRRPAGPGAGRPGHGRTGGTGGRGVVPPGRRRPRRPPPLTGPLPHPLPPRPRLAVPRPALARPVDHEVSGDKWAGVHQCGRERCSDRRSGRAGGRRWAPAGRARKGDGPGGFRHRGRRPRTVRTYAASSAPVAAVPPRSAGTASGTASGRSAPRKTSLDLSMFSGSPSQSTTTI